jgi:3-phosphoshikimate 1-carboxyvinyltransferase
MSTSEFCISAKTKPLRGTLHVPTDKSISHRAAIFGALADGDTRIANFCRAKPRAPR